MRDYSATGLVYALLFLSSVSIVACQFENVLRPEEIVAADQELLISSMDLKDGRTIRFNQDSLGYATRQDSSVCRQLPGGSLEAYRFDEISQIHTVQYLTTGENIAIGTGLAVAIVLTVVAIGGAQLAAAGHH